VDLTAERGVPRRQPSRVVGGDALDDRGGFGVMQPNPLETTGIRSASDA
jgi:hypothetical protein